MTPKTSDTHHQLDPAWQAQFKDKWRKAVLYDHNLKMGTKAIAVATLEDYNRTDPERVGTTFNKSQTVADKMGCNEKKVRTAWGELRDAGYLHSLGRSSSGRGVYIHRFDMPLDEIRPDKTSELTGQNVRSDRIKRPMEQEEHNKKNLTNRTSYICSSQANERDTPNPKPINFFIEEEEPQRHDEFIDYWSAVATTHDNHHAYDTVLDLFIKDMTEKNCSHWGSTFMKAMKTYLDPNSTGLDEHFAYELSNPEELENTPPPEETAQDLAQAWAGNDDRPQEFRKAWERALLAGHEPIRIIAIGASPHVRSKYPRELVDILNSLKKFELSKAVAAYRNTIIKQQDEQTNEQDKQHA